MTLEELELVREALRLTHNAGVMGESEACSTKRYEAAEVRARDAVHAVEDCACDHDWQPFGGSGFLKRCERCNSRRALKDAQ